MQRRLSQESPYERADRAYRFDEYTTFLKTLPLLAQHSIPDSWIERAQELAQRVGKTGKLARETLFYIGSAPRV